MGVQQATRVGVYQNGEDDQTATFDREFGKLAEITGQPFSLDEYDLVGVFEFGNDVAITYSSGGSCWLTVVGRNNGLTARELMSLTQGLEAPCLVVDTANGHPYELPITVLWSKHGIS